MVSTSAGAGTQLVGARSQQRSSCQDAKGVPPMRHPSAPNDNGSDQRGRTRGAIRTHLGRKRNGPRTRRLDDGTLVRMQEAGHVARRREEDLFDKLLGQFQSVFDTAGEKTASAFDAALDVACTTLVTAGEFTSDSAQLLR